MPELNPEDIHAGQRASAETPYVTALVGFLAGFQTIDISNRGTVQHGDVALLYPQFNLQGTGPDGKATTLDGHGTKVVRRHSAHGWLYVIDDPFSPA
jgi:ketosteroid isomerase-like protein